MKATIQRGDGLDGSLGGRVHQLRKEEKETSEKLVGDTVGRPCTNSSHPGAGTTHLERGGGEPKKGRPVPKQTESNGL